MNRIKNKVVIHYLDKRLLKGFTYNFNPNVEKFHVNAVSDQEEVHEVPVDQLKAVFFVKKFEGNDPLRKDPDFTKESLKNFQGLKMKITFSDGEVIFGTTNGYAPDRKGFFLFPADAESNNERIFVLKNAVDHIEVWH